MPPALALAARYPTASRQTEPRARALFFAAAARLTARFRRRSVKAFDEVAEQASAVASHPVGLREIPVSAIVGSVGRWQQLDASFRMGWWHSSRAEQQRYRRVEAAMRLGRVPLPPISAYLLDGDYFVLDGHHRVAAALKLGQLFIDAEVVEYRRSRPASSVPTWTPARRVIGETACDRGFLQAA